MTDRQTSAEVLAEIRKHIQLLAEESPDVASGDSEKDDVIDFWLGLFNAYGDARAREAVPPFCALAVKAVEHEAAAEIVKRNAQTERRFSFQLRHTHYTPPPFSTESDREAYVFAVGTTGSADLLYAGLWDRWRAKNLQLHGAEGFAARFPEHTTPDE